MSEHVIQRSIWIAAARERVWQAVTDPAQIQQWFSPTIPWKVSALGIGGKIYAEGYESQMGIIEVLDAPRAFGYRWTSADEPITTLTTFTLDEENGGTRVTISETMSGDLSDAAIRARLGGNENGWQIALENIQAYLEGKPLPFPNGL